MISLKVKAMAKHSAISRLENVPLTERFSGEVPASIVEFSGREWKEPVDHAVAEILPVVPQSDGTTKLEVRDEPFTRLHERHYGGRGDLLAVSIVDVDNRFFRFEVFRRR